MKLESLKSSKFEAFKGSEVSEAFSVVGGAPQATTYKSGSESGNDTMNCDTTDSKTTQTDMNGKVIGHCDYQRTSIAVNPSINGDSLLPSVVAPSVSL